MISLTPFADFETAKRWNHSAQYEAARHVRAGAAELNMMVVEGLSSRAFAHRRDVKNRPAV
ncbi:DUF1330 domain-containing protein [Caballeronia sordidicola]|uniref:DUF1330 domain-containing protein n=1 Tax=Caballeronia sordidicola TaxID=196367 RepID=UPI00359455B0